MRVISKSTLRDFWNKYPDARGPLRAWYTEAKKENWTSPNDIKNMYGSASIVANNKVVFNICGNKYRLVVRIVYNFKIVYIRFIGTHKEYDKVNVETI